MTTEIGLSDTEWRVIAHLLPDKPRGVRRVDDRRVIGGILWVLRGSGRWHTLPVEFGPRTTCYNRYVRWQKSGVWDRLMEAIEPQHNIIAQAEASLGYSRGEETRTRILGTALKRFALSGFDGVSTRHIAAAAGVPPASLRYYFKSKQGLYDACLAYIHRISVAMTDSYMAAAERLLKDVEVPADRLIAAYCAIQASYADVLIGFDDGMLALFVVRNDLPTEGGLRPAHTDDPFGARIFSCHIELILRISRKNLTIEDAILVWIMIHGQLITMCMSRQQLEAHGGAFTAERVSSIKRIMRRQTAAILRDYALQPRSRA